LQRKDENGKIVVFRKRSNSWKRILQGTPWKPTRGPKPNMPAKLIVQLFIGIMEDYNVNILDKHDPLTNLCIEGTMG
jgi:hypothetical protein